MQERTSIPPAKPSGTTPAQPSLAVLHTLATLHAHFGATPSEELTARLAQAPISTMVAEGQRITTERLVREAPSIVSAAMTVVAQLLPDQRDLLPALDGGFFRAAVTVIHTCDQRGETRGDAVGSATRLTRENRAARRALVNKAKAQRKVVYAAASSLSGADPARKELLDAAWGKGEAPEHLARSLAEMTALLREWVLDARSRKVPTDITDAWIDRQAATATGLTDVTEQADARATVGEVAQGDVAWWRGAALWFLRQMADMIDAAHDADPRIPRLPLGNLRAAIRRPKAKKKADAKDPPAPAAKKPDAPAKPDAPQPA